MLDPKKVPVNYVIERRMRLKPSGRDYLRGVEHDSLVIDLRKNIFHWNSIDLHGDALTWLQEVEGLSYRHALETLEAYSGLPFTRNFDKMETPTPIYQGLLESFFNLGKHNREYWYGRGLTDTTIDKYKLGYSGNSVYVIPLFKSGRLHNFQCRHSEKKRIWNWASGRGPTLFGQNKLRDTSYVLLAEGPIDALILNQMGLPAISHNGGAGAWDDAWNKHILEFNFIYVIYDNDSAGKAASRRISKRLLNRGYVLSWPTFLDDAYDVNAAYLEFGETKTKTLITEVMMPNAIHSSDIDKQKHNIDNEARSLLYE